MVSRQDDSFPKCPRCHSGKTIGLEPSAQQQVIFCDSCGHLWHPMPESTPLVRVIVGDDGKQYVQ